ncbi:MAG: fibronectin type III domain-containing protein, partial [Verrucomicrobiales bacterium]
GRAGGSLRWHIFVRNPGPVRLNVHLEVFRGDTSIDVGFAGQTKRVRTAKSGSESPQPWDLLFHVDKPGAYPLSLRAVEFDGGRGGVGRLHRVDAFGPGIREAHLLRTRWRPAAVHGGYDTESVRNVKLVVFTTQSMTRASNYSPITTPFGYFGTTFGDDRRSGGGFNFSMWGGNGGASNLKLMPHLLGVGSPVGQFSGFGHEGSGVKPRGWEPMPDRPKVVVQALRLVSGEEYDSYFGYYFDHPSKAWRFYGAGNKWHGGKSTEHLRLGSFCEVPGPPQNERSGDLYREVRRKLWAYDLGNWVALEDYSPRGKGSSGDELVNKRWFTGKGGEYAMGCGGIRLYRHEDSEIKEMGGGDELPYFLSSPTIETIFRMPIDYGAIQATEISSDRAVIELEIRSGKELQGATVYYGITDALTFAPRQLHGTEKNSELSQSVNSKTWQEMREIPAVVLGTNRITLENLEPGTTYFYRVLVKDEASQIWNDKTLSFSTPEA